MLSNKPAQKFHIFIVDFCDVIFFEITIFPFANKCHNIWGKKRLAYQIDNQKYGTFVLMNFETEEGSGIAGFESYMKLNISVLRAQTIRLKSRPTEAVLEKSIPLDNKNKFHQPLQDQDFLRV